MMNQPPSLHCAFCRGLHVWNEQQSQPEDDDGGGEKMSTFDRALLIFGIVLLALVILFWSTVWGQMPELFEPHIFESTVANFFEARGFNMTVFKYWGTESQITTLIAEPTSDGAWDNLFEDEVDQFFAKHGFYMSTFKLHRFEDDGNNVGILIGAHRP
jgi:hypothetical protein